MNHLSDRLNNFMKIQKKKKKKLLLVKDATLPSENSLRFVLDKIF